MTVRGRPLRAAVLGAGLMGEWHARSITRVGASVAAVIDTDRFRAERLAKRFGGSEADTAFASVAEKGICDVAHICTPTETHEPLITAALVAGLHVLVEKPVAPTADACARLLDLAESRGVLLCPVFQFPYQEGVARALDRLPALGTPHHIDFVACSAGAEGLPDGGPEAVAADIVLHALSLLGRFLPDEAGDDAWQVQHGRPGELRASRAMGKATVSILVSMHGRPTRNTCRIIAERGTIHLDLFHGFSLVERGRATRTGKLQRPFAVSASVITAAATNLARRSLGREPAYPGLRTLIERFYAAVRTGGPSPVTAAETRRIAEVRDAIYRSGSHQ